MSATVNEVALEVERSGDVGNGLDVDGPLDRTWTCDRGGDLHCGRCGPCFMRRVAFEINGTTDPVLRVPASTGAAGLMAASRRRRR